MIRDKWVGDAKSVMEQAAEGGGDSCQGPAPGWFRNRQCGADGARGSPCGCENIELRSGSVGVGTSLRHLTSRQREGPASC